MCAVKRGLTVLVFPAYLGVYMGMGAILKQKC